MRKAFSASASEPRSVQRSPNSIHIQQSSGSRRAASANFSRAASWFSCNLSIRASSARNPASDRLNSCRSTRAASRRSRNAARAASNSLLSINADARARIAANSGLSFRSRARSARSRISSSAVAARRAGISASVTRFSPSFSRTARSGPPGRLWLWQVRESRPAEFAGCVSRQRQW